MLNLKEQTKIHDDIWQEWSGDLTKERKDARINWVLDKMSKRRVTTVLDTACGPGWYTQVLSNAGYEVLGTDISSVAINMARKAFPDIKFQVLAIEETLQLKPFDAIVCLGASDTVINEKEAIDIIAQRGIWGYFSFQDYMDHPAHLRKANLKSIGELLNDYDVTYIEKIPDFWMAEVKFIP